MGLFGGIFDRGSKRGEARTERSDDRDYLVAWATSHEGVEGFVEPENQFNDVTIVLVDKDGSWTRRAPGGAKGAERVGKKAAIPVYDVVKVGYPQRMRDHIERNRIRRRREQRAQLVGGGDQQSRSQPAES